jgi:hypothetical protein
LTNPKKGIWSNTKPYMINPQRGIDLINYNLIIINKILFAVSMFQKKGEQYFMLLVDDYISMTAVCFLMNKSEDFENFKVYKEVVENEMDSKIKCLRSDNGGEFTSKEFLDFCSNHRIKRKFYVARTPQHNGVVEIKNKRLHEMARTMLMD